MRGVIIHAPKDLRIEEVASEAARTARRPGAASRRAGSAGRTSTTIIMAVSAPSACEQPMALGHEIAGTVEDVGAEVSGVARGMRVAVNPSQPCNACRYCRAGQRNQCLDMKFMGSAMRFPHVQGGFRESVTVDEAQADPDRADDDDGRSRHGGAAGGLPARRGTRRLAPRRAGAGDGLRPDRRPRDRRRPACAARRRSSRRT